ncbi:MAG: radical SAM protein [Bacteroidota bacterium]
MFRYFIKVFGCPMRGVEAERVHRYFKANGGKPADREKADVIMIFGCSIVETTNAITMDYIKATDNDKQRIIISGCSPVMSQQEIKSFFKGELLVSSQLDEIDSLFPDFTVPFENIPLPAKSHKNLEYNTFYLNQFKQYQKPRLLNFHLSPQLIITSHGCPNACTYCTVRLAMGKLKSYSISRIENTYKTALAKNQQVFIFNGDDTGAYGLDIQNSFDELMLHLDNITPKEKYVRWAIDNLHPRWLLKYQNSFSKLVEKKRIVDMIVPFQAASDPLLKRMRRNYNIQEVISVLKTLKALNPEVKLTSHFMFGFPGETDEDVQAIKTIIDQNVFSHFVLLRYFESPMADSHKMTPKIPVKKIQKDMQEIEKYILDKGYICQMTDYTGD